MPKLLFKNPVFEPGLNLTVRRGVKWDVAEKKGVEIAATDKPDEVLHLVDIQTKVMRCEDILTDDLGYEHDPECRTWEGLCSAMHSVYGFDFIETEVVTLVWFTIAAGGEGINAELVLSDPRRAND